MTDTSPVLDLDRLLGEESFVRSLARSLLFDEHDVDEVVQQTWLQALERPPAATGSPRGWLARVVRSKASNLRRGESRRREREDAVVAGLPSNEEIRARESCRREVVEAVLALEEPYRSTVLLRYFEHLAPRRIAARLGIPRDTVKTRLKRALPMLRRHLDRKSDGDRRSWCLALVPLAVPRRAVVGVLLSKAAIWAGAFWTMKHSYILVAAAAALLVLGSSLFWGDGLSGFVPLGTGDAMVGDVAAASSDKDAEEEVSSPRVEAPVRREAKAAVPPSVERALAGFVGRLVLPGGEPAAGEVVRLTALDAARDLGSVAARVRDEGVQEGAEESAAAAMRTPADPRGAQQGPRYHDARSEEDGTFELTGVWPGSTCLLRAGVGGDHPTMRVLNETPGPGEIVDLGVIELVANGAISGQVVGSDGEPIAGAEVWAADLPGAFLALAPLDRLRTMDALVLSLPDAAAAERAERDPKVYARLMKSHLASGILRNRGGAERVLLELPKWSRRFVAELPTPRTQTAADGSFLLRGVPAGNSFVVAHIEGRAPATRARVRVTAGKTSDIRTLRMRDGESLTGRVVDAAGQALAGAQVRVAPRPMVGLTGALLAGARRVCDAEGRFVESGLVRGNVVAAIRRGDGDPWSFVDDLSAGDEDVDLQLDDTAELRLAVRSDAGHALEDVRVELVQGPPIGELSVAGMTPRLALAGRREQLADDRYRLVRLVPGLYTVTVAAADHVPVTRVLRAEAPAAVPDMARSPMSEEATFTLVAEASCAVEVVDARGQPVHGARVIAQPRAAEAWAHSVIYGHGAEGLRGWSRLARVAGKTDASGQVVVSGLPVGAAYITVTHPAFGAACAEASLPGRTRVVLADTGSIRGRLFDHGAPADARIWRLVAVNREDDWPSGMPRQVGHAVPGAGGHFEFRGLEPGRYSVRVERSTRDVLSLGALFEKFKDSYTISFDMVRREEVVVEAGREATLDLDVDEARGLPGTLAVRLSGQVTIDGDAVAGCELRHGVLWNEQVLCKTGADGRFSVDRVKAQVLTLKVVPPQWRGVAWRAMVRIRGDADVQLDIDVQTGVLNGTVLTPSGDPLAGQRVYVGGRLAGQESGLLHNPAAHIPGTRAPSPRCEVDTVTDAQGRFSVRVPVGSYKCSASGPKGRGVAADLEVSAGGALDCKVQLKPDGVVAGRVLWGGKPPGAEGIWIWMRQRGVPEATWDMRRVEKTGSVFHFDRVAPGAYELFIQGSDYGRRKAIPHVVDVTESGCLDLVLRPGELAR